MSVSLCSWRCRNLGPRLNKEYENHFEQEVIVTKHTIILCLLLGATSIWAQTPCVADSEVVLPAVIPSSACVNLCAGAALTVYCIPLDPPCDFPIVMVTPGCQPMGSYCERECPPAQFSYNYSNWVWDANAGYWENSIIGLSDGCACLVRQGPLGPPGYIHLDPADGLPQTACLSFINTALCIGPVDDPERYPILQVNRGCDTTNSDFHYTVTYNPAHGFWVTFSGIDWEEWGCYCITLEGFSADTECSPGDSIIYVAPDSPGYYNHVPHCLYFCAGRTYFLYAPMCRSDMWPGPPMIEWSPGCFNGYWACGDEECALASEIAVGDPFWLSGSLTWVVPVMLAPGGEEGCACVQAMFWLEGWYWNGDCWLSVELLTFSAAAEGDDILIEFATASETNNDYFEIWRGESPSGTFTKIAELPSQGNGSTGHHYSYTDRDVMIGATYWYYLADVDLQGNRREHRDFMTSACVEAPVPLNYELFQNYPNPFNAATEIGYMLPEASHVLLTVYNSTGQQVAQLVNESQAANTYRVKFDAAPLPSGIYVYAIEVNGYREARKMVLIR